MRISYISITIMALLIASAVSPVFSQETDKTKPSAKSFAKEEPVKKASVPETIVTPPFLPKTIIVEDVDNDAGEKLKLSWSYPDPEKKVVTHVEAKLASHDEFEEIGKTDVGVFEFEAKNLTPGETYEFRLKATTEAGGDSEYSEIVTGVPIRQWIDKSKKYLGFFMLVVCLSVFIFIQLAKSGKTLKVRKIAGLEAIEEAVGRATEMGRDCLFVPGIQDINDIQTVAGITVLSRVAELTAEYDAGLDVPTTRALVMTTARETVDGAYTAAGRPDLYNPDNIYYLTDEQFGFVAAVTGKMVREKPAACFYMGAFYAESLIFAETANTIGAIQIAGTAMPSQLPFFVAACDYVLIGEELFAASAYLSGEPQQLGSLKGQDVGKLIAGIFLIIGPILMTLEQLIPEGQILNAIKAAVYFMKEDLLGT